MRLTILYFAWVRERIGFGEEEIDAPDERLTVAEVIARLARTSEAHASALGDVTKIRAALDQTLVTLGAPLGRARELAIFPPVTGG